MKSTEALLEFFMQAQSPNLGETEHRDKYHD